jgi:hypothetical protein
MPNGRRKLYAAFPALAAGALALALYAVTLGGTYVYDDVQIIGNDPRIESPGQWGLIWTRDYFNGAIDNLYRPLTTQTYALQWWIHGNRPWAFHLVNILLNAAACAAVAEFARRLAGAKVALIGGLLFAAHPVHVEAVAGIVGRCEEMCTLFMFSGLCLFMMRPLTTGRALAIGACSIAAMLSKEQGMFMPAFLLVLGICTGRRPQSAREKQAMMLLTLLLCWSVAGLVLLREEVLNLKFEWPLNFLDDAIQPLVRSTPMNHALMVFVILGHYAQLLIFPARLSIDYGLSVLTAVADRGDPYLYLGMAVAIAGIAALAVAIWRRCWIDVFCLVCGGLCYGMVSNVVLIGTIFGERLMYIPSAFLLILLSIYIARLRPAMVGGILTVVLVAMSARTITYAAQWNDRLAFYLGSLEQQPLSVRLHELAAFELMEHGELSQAKQIAADGIGIAPDYWNIWYCRGMIEEKMGDTDAALADYQKAFGLDQIVLLDAKVKELKRRQLLSTQPASWPASAQPANGTGTPGRINSGEEHP